MNINLTLIGQSITFFVFAWFCWQFVWPAIRSKMEERERTIAEGLAAADRASRDLEQAQERAAQQLREAKKEAGAMLEQAQKRARQIVEDAKHVATDEADRLKAHAQTEIDQEVVRVKEQLRTQVSTLAVQGAERILGVEIDQQRHNALVEDLIKSL